MVAIMGASGSGKSTLLNIIGCLDVPTQGEYLLKEKDISSLSNKELAKLRNQVLGFVVQDFALVEQYTVAQNIAIPLIYSKISRLERKKHIDIILDQMDILEKKKVLVSNLSGGQRQRVAIARALANSPDIILADEPTGSLDSQMSQEIMELFAELNRQGKTVIIVTHDPMVAEFCQKIIHIKDGKLAEQNVV